MNTTIEYCVTLLCGTALVIAAPGRLWIAGVILIAYAVLAPNVAGWLASRAKSTE